MGLCASEMSLLGKRGVDKILIVEDDIRVAELVANFLRKENYSVDVAHTTVSALRAPLEQFHLFIIDLMLPDEDGVALAKKLRTLNIKSPILMLTAIDEELQEVFALDSGVDDYLTKPVQPQRLLARVKALLRRQGRKNETFQLDEIRRECYLFGKTISLTDAEFDLIQFFYINRNRKVRRDELVTVLRGFEYDGLDRSIDMRVSSLRRKLGDDVPPYKLIKTIRGYGYMLSVGTN